MADQVDVDFDEEMLEVEMAPIRQSNLATPEQCIENWKEKFSTHSLTNIHFKEWWRVWVPRIYSPPLNGNCLEWSSDIEKAEKYLFNILVEFICDGDPREVLTKLAELNKPAAVCGRVFKMGEPTYNCRECGMDSTCVLCVDCFKQSAHRNHKYKMGTSIGGGCCDCGDDEAWKNEPYCDIHIKGRNLKEETGTMLPADLSERARITFDAILWYAYNLLTLEHNPGLPADLKMFESERSPLSFLESPNVYCVVLYNDETHTFEQVISTLARVIKCSQRDAIEFVTNIDREGRAVVKCSTFQHCTELKVDIEKYTSRFGNKPLKVLVVHSHVVAHQLFAIKLLEWLTNFLANGEGFRTIFSKVACEAKLPDISIVEGILLRDSQMWKSARSHWHHLLISGMLMEYESKKALATIFTKNYGHVMKDFIRDDHDHSFSVSSLSVQLYTVPTLAHHLIANEDVLFILLNTFISECSRKCNSSGKLAFERNASTNSFKRAQFMLYDIKYLLSSKPKEWTDNLRRGFLQGLSIILNLLTMMQGMDSVSRQVGQHIDYEPEWESAFNLHIKLAGVITLALEWCGSDTKVLVKAYKATLKKLYDNPSYDTYQVNEIRELADHAATCLQYDVSTQPVSIHLPLTRFLAGLHLYLEAHSLNFDNDFQAVKPTPEQIMEPVLRTQAMISQVNAGMWRRNGYALLNQLYFYHNVKCRTEMLDRDIILLQIAASLIESNEFLIHIINKFNLFNWANPCFEENSLKSSEEDSMRQTINLVEEFLSLLINIVGERFVPGIGKVTLEDRIKNEIIQQLCIKPLPHSELIKTIPEEILNEAALDSLIDEVAIFKKPVQGSGKGVYELKSEFFDRYNVFFYHYTREELSKSEEVQRKRRKADGKLECCPPPDLPELCESFSIVANLLQSDVMLHIMRTVLQRSNNLRARSFSEPQVHKVLHLIGYALQEQESKRYPFLVFTERANKWDILPLLEELASSARVESHKDLLVWTLNKYKDVSLSKNPNDNASGESSTFVEHKLSVSDTAKDEKEWRAKMAAQKRAKLMAQMTTLQNNFMKEMAQLLPENTSSEKKDDSAGNSSMDMSEVVETPVCLGPNQTPKVSQERHFTCILCQEEQTVSVDGEALVLAAFVQQSTVLCQQRNLPQETVSDEPLFLSANLGPAPYTSTCGHVMHSVCWQKYFDNVLTKESRRPYRLRHPVSFDVEKDEYLCPLCECLSNTILPLIPPLCNLQTPPTQEKISFPDWMKFLTVTLHSNADATQKTTAGAAGSSASNSDVVQGSFISASSPSDSNNSKVDYTNKLMKLAQASSLQEVVDILGEHIDAVFENNFATDTKEVSETFKNVIMLYARTTYIRSFGFPAIDFSKTLLIVWNSCAYTIRTMEMLLRDLNKSLLGDLSCRQRDCLESLVRIVSILASTSKHNNFFELYTSRLLGSLLETSPDNPSFLDWDTFGMLVPLVLSFPSYISYLLSKPELGVIPTGGIHDYYIFQLVYLNHITKILLVNDLTDCGTEMDIDIDTPLSSHENQLIIDVYKTIKKTDNTTLTGQQIWNYIKDASIPFLRCCILFFHFLTDVPAPSVFSEVGGDTFSEMMKYLGFTDTCEYWMGTLKDSNLISVWCSHPNVVKYQNNRNEVDIIKEPAVVNHLVTLPMDYSELINTVSLFTCPNSDREDSRNPTMCLVCGEMLCSQSYCCQTELNKILVGACTYHAHKCGAGVGIFLRVRECEILFLASPNRGCFVSSPYLDNYGETDQGLRRGNPLHLSKELYKKLHTLWLSHGLHEEIARALESTSNLLSTQWQHL